MKVPSIKPAPDPAPAEPPHETTAPSVPAPSPPARGPFGYLGRLWRAEIPLARVFWQDMVVIGTAINLLAMGLAFVAVVLGASTPAGIAIHLSPVPYNILLVASVWRRADAERANWGWLARFGSLLWLILAFVV